MVESTQPHPCNGALSLFTYTDALTSALGTKPPEGCAQTAMSEERKLYVIIDSQEALQPTKRMTTKAVAIQFCLLDNACMLDSSVIG